MALDEQDEVREHLEEVNDGDSNLDDRRMQVINFQKYATDQFH